MTAYKSTQETNRTTLATGGTPLKPNESHGRVRMAFFNYTTVGEAIDDTIDLVTLPKGARILGGHLAWSALSSGDGTSNIRVGTSADDDRYLGDTSVEAAGSADIANTLALNYGEELSAETTLVAKVKGEALAAAGTIKGHVLYVVD